MEGLRHAEAGERLGISEGAARVHLFNARRKLRVALAAHQPRATARAS
jgi:DNA-directed RNA polymerase specialized sigma24 family protein